MYTIALKCTLNTVRYTDVRAGSTSAILDKSGQKLHLGFEHLWPETTLGIRLFTIFNILIFYLLSCGSQQS